MFTFPIPRQKELKQRSAVEPVIGHMKSDGKLNHNYLRGILEDKINALLCGAGHNIRIILRKLREWFLFFVFLLILKKKSVNFPGISAGGCIADRLKMDFFKVDYIMMK